MFLQHFTASLAYRHHLNRSALQCFPSSKHPIISNAFKTDFYQLRTPPTLAATLSAAVRVHLKAIKQLKHEKTKLASWKSFLRDVTLHG